MQRRLQVRSSGPSWGEFSPRTTVARESQPSVFTYSWGLCFSLSCGRKGVLLSHVLPGIITMTSFSLMGGSF